MYKSLENMKHKKIFKFQKMLLSNKLKQPRSVNFLKSCIKEEIGINFKRLFSGLVLSSLVSVLHIRIVNCKIFVHNNSFVNIFIIIKKYINNNKKDLCLCIYLKI